MRRTQEDKDRLSLPFKLGRRKSALGNLPEDESRFPVSTWLKRLLSKGVQGLVLNSQLIRQASPPGQPARIQAGRLEPSLGCGGTKEEVPGAIRASGFATYKRLCPI